MSGFFYYLAGDLMGDVEIRLNALELLSIFLV